VTRYYVDISSDLVEEYKHGEAQVPEGWRLVERWGPRSKDMERWIVEDDGASEEFEDYLVCPEFKMTLTGEGPDYTVEVVKRIIS
jgi:hypothetical protein